jgi:hypothetical protein
MSKLLRTVAATVLVGALATGIAAAGPGDRHGPHGRDMMGSIDFSAIDANADGSLSHQELTDRATSRISEADTNGDGYVDREELAKQMPSRSSGFGNVFGVDPALEHADAVIAMLGGTADGRVSVSTMAEHRVNMLLAFIDEDRDDAISQMEAQEMARHGEGHPGMMRGERDGRHRGEHPAMMPDGPGSLPGGDDEPAGN